MFLAASSVWVDVAAVALLALFGLWGAFHGALRQGLGFLVLAAGFSLAGPAGPRLESSLAKIVTLSPSGTACAAWGTAFLGVLVVGGIVLHLARQPLNRVRLPGFDRAAGALIGVVKGVMVVALLVYVLLGAFVGSPAPSLAAAVRESVTARCARSLEQHYRSIWGLSPLVERRVEDVHASIGVEATP